MTPIKAWKELQPSGMLVTNDKGSWAVSVTSLRSAEALLEGVQLAGTGEGAGRDLVKDCSVLPQYF